MEKKDSLTICGGYYLQKYCDEVICKWNYEKWIFQTRKLKPRSWVWGGLFIDDSKMQISRSWAAKLSPEIFDICQSCLKGNNSCLCWGTAISNDLENTDF